MRIGLYGLPTVGKTYILDKISFLDVVSGSTMLREICPEFDLKNDVEKNKIRMDLANILMSKDNFIVDGHYAFGDKIVFTESDGKLYDVFIYLYLSPEKIRERMAASIRNKKYLSYNIEEWQKYEINCLREYCHMNDKDFYVLDNPPQNEFDDISSVIEFIKGIVSGYSCVTFAERCANEILKHSSSNIITLMDGDKTVTVEDSSNAVFGYTTCIYDGNFYTGYQMWKQMNEFKTYEFADLSKLPVSLNEEVCNAINNETYILTSGHEKVWKYIAGYLNIPYFAGVEMSAETKLYITKRLQAAGKTVVAYGDGMNDYYMLKQADKGFLVRKKGKTVSKSLEGMDLEGLIYV